MLRKGDSMRNITTMAQLADEIRRVENKKKNQEYHQKNPKKNAGKVKPQWCLEDSCFAKSHGNCQILSETYSSKGECPFRKETRTERRKSNESV